MNILSRIKHGDHDDAEKDQLLTTQEENQLLKASLECLKSELNKFKEPPLLICEVKRVLPDRAIIKVSNGNTFLVSMLKNLAVSPGDVVLVEQKSLTVVQRLEKSRSFDAENFLVAEKPTIRWEELGGLHVQAEEIREVVELPLNNPALFKQLGIQPPKGVLLHGPPGTGKTLLAKAVAASTQATFIEIVASELVQKFIGEGAKLVKDIFEFAREKAPAIIFIDELDALGGQRMELGTSGEREVQRTLMQLLTEMDGFQSLDNVKIIGATNRLDLLDPALLRPGRFDRIIHVPIPDKEGRQQILNIHTQRMHIKDIIHDSIIEKTEGFTGAEIRAACTEAGYFAIRAQRTEVTTEDFLQAIEKVSQKQDPESIDMYG